MSAVTHHNRHEHQHYINLLKKKKAKKSFKVLTRPSKNWCNPPRSMQEKILHIMKSVFNCTWYQLRNKMCFHRRNIPGMTWFPCQSYPEQNHMPEPFFLWGKEQTTKTKEQFFSIFFLILYSAFFCAAKSKQTMRNGKHHPTAESKTLHWDIFQSCI